MGCWNGYYQLEWMVKNTAQICGCAKQKIIWEIMDFGKIPEFIEEN